MTLIISELLTMARLALTLLVDKEQRKYIDELATIEKALYAEENKPLVPPPDNPNADLRSDAVIDNLHEQLCIVTASIAADIKKPVT